MKKQKKDEWKPEAFPQPRTFPMDWDGSALMSTNGHPIKDEKVNPPSQNKDVKDWNPEKFPKPRTYPKNWSIDD